MSSVRLLILASLVLVTLAAGCNRHSGFGRGSVDRPRDGGVVPDSGLPPGDGLVETRDDGGPSECDAGSVLCGDACVDLGSDGRNCGECGHACAPEETCSDALCVGGPPGCAEPRVMCDGSCVDLATNPANCGDCFHTCPTGTFCSDYECVSSCTPSCGGRECGSDGCGGTCGSCGAGESCLDGLCESTCGSGQLLCSGVCRTVATDPSNCGACAHVCTSGYACVSGVCTPPSTGSGESCASPLDLPSTGGSRTFTFTGHSANHTPFTCGTTSATPDVAYRWTPARSGTATFRAAGPTSATDTMLAVFSSSSCTSTYSIACNDDEVSGVFSSVATASVTAGSTYYIVVAPYSSTTDTITLTVTAP